MRVVFFSSSSNNFSCEQEKFYYIYDYSAEKKVLQAERNERKNKK